MKKIILLMFMCILFIPIVSAFEFDNVKTYNEETRTYTINNAFGLGEKIADIRLITPQFYKRGIGYTDIAQFELCNYDNTYGNAFQDINFYQANDISKELWRTFDYKYKSLEQETEDTYEKVCEWNDKNQSMECELIKNGTEIYYKNIWIKFLDINEIPQQECITIGIFTNTQKNDYVEWIPTLFGEYLNKWASWTSNLDLGLISYYKMDEEATGSGNIIDELGVNNFTNVNTVNVTGKIIRAYAYSGTDQCMINGIDMGDLGTQDFTINMWVNPAVINFNNYLFDSETPAIDVVVKVSDTTGALHFRTQENGISTSVTTGIEFMTLGWQMLTFRREGTTLSITRNAGTPVTNTGIIRDLIGAGTMFLGSTEDQLSGFFFNGKIDEVGIWNRSLTSLELDNLYNNSNGLAYQFIEPPIITLNYPINDYSTSYSTINFNCSATYSTKLELIIDGLSINWITNTTPSETLYYDNDIINILDGSHNWSCNSTLESGEETAGDTRNFTVDSIAPTLNIIEPIETYNYGFLGQNITLNFTASDLNLDSCWYNYNGTNITVPCTNEVYNQSYFNLTTNRTIYLFVNDTAGNENNTDSTWNYNIYLNSITYENSTFDTQIEDYSINITSESGVTINSIILNYDGINYTVTYSDISDTYIANKSLLVASVSTITNRTFYWIIDTSAGNIQIESYNQIINPIYALTVENASCSAGTSIRKHFNFSTEINLTALTGMTIDYNLKYGLENNTAKSVYGTLSGVTDFYICLNESYNETYILGYGEFEYYKTDYVNRKYYLFEDDTITINRTNHTLYSLVSSSATSFLLTIQDKKLNPYKNYYSTLLRWYPEDDEYKVVEMGITDENGQTVQKVEVEDAQYRIGVYETDGTLIYLAQPISMICIESPCSYVLSIPDISNLEYSNFADLEYSLAFSGTTFTLIYNDPSQTTSLINLEAYKMSGTNELLLCSDNSSASTGVLTCDVGNTSGQIKAIGFRSASPFRPFVIQYIDSGVMVFEGTFGLFITLIITITIILLGIVSPITAIIMGVLALIPAMLLGVVSYGIIIGIGILGGIVIHYMRRS